MKTEFIGTCSKDLDDAEHNEDQVAVSANGLTLALCDGASESYDSRLWAAQLAARFVADPRFGPEWIARAAEDYAAAHDYESLSWSRQAAFERGSFATLLGIEHDELHDAVDALAIGDCVALLVDGGRLVRAWPFDDPERFKERPTLLSTIAGHNGFASAPDFWARSATTFELRELAAPRLYCLTDAVGEWALRQARAGADPWSQLGALASDADLRELVARERSAKRLRVDDSTLAILSFQKAPPDDALPNA